MLRHERIEGKMSTQPAATNSAIITDYRARTPGSGALFERAHKVLPSGITHDARYLDPYSIHVAKAKGARKWDVDGNEYVDYFGGHGAMLLGHSHPAVIEAVKKQIELGTHQWRPPQRCQNSALLCGNALHGMADFRPHAVRFRRGFGQTTGKRADQFAIFGETDNLEPRHAFLGEAGSVNLDGALLGCWHRRRFRGIDWL